MALTVAELSADLGINTRPFDTGLKGIVGKFGKLGPMAAAGGAAIAAGIAMGGKALLDLGDSFDNAFDTIRVGTGATGAELAGLQKDFKAVFADVPTDMASVGTAIADLNTRLGLTGKPLQDLAKQFLDLSRITGTDLATNIASVTRVFGDWQISAKEQAGALDAMFRAAQASGIGFDDLSTSVVKFGAPLRNLGFTFEDSLALLSQFDKAGVNTQTVFGGLRAGIGKLAKDGESVPDTFRRVVAEIEKLGPGSEATALAIELFGQRAGPDLADAITGGKFAIDDMLGAISKGKDTVRGAAKDTDDWRESLTVLKNKALVVLEPVVMALFDALGWLADALVAVSENKDVQAFFRDVGATAKEFVGVIADMVAPIRKHWGTIKAVIGAALSVVADILRAGMAAMRGDWSGAWNLMKGVVIRAWGGIKSAVSAGITALGKLIRSLPGKIKGWLGDLGGLLKDAGRAIIQGLLDGLKEKYEDVKDFVTGIGGWIKDHKGPLDDDIKLLQPAGRAIMQGLQVGIAGELGALDSLLGRVSDSIVVSARPQLAFAGSAYAATPATVEEHYHIHMPGGTTLVGSAETVGRMIAPAVGRENRIAQQRRARRR